MGRPAFKLRFDPPYDEAFSGLPKFRTFADTEHTIRKLGILQEAYRAAHDNKGLKYCQQTALEGRRRAELIGRNRKVSPIKRLHKKEIAHWFQVWLETPAIFDSWLALRKTTAEYQGLLISERLDADTLDRPSFSPDR